ncbi:D-alanyl-D-alanine carboxypeptidase [Bacillus sp. THAF10]|uniref:M15 family metallopeptidase n=1 Tax=Bacillus sp. THAF10 TaxID=2587848 RepID=UPI001267BB8A|nr:M15 family metallopeptidase [Bacillus sp. THAF10]QFT87464.1 D-alanyl-D-alanine carboxypeptidase [Bacillus sp. THAF10]
MQKIKIGIIGVVSAGVLAGCGNVPQEELVGKEHSLKTAIPIYSDINEAAWEEFLAKAEAEEPPETDDEDSGGVGEGEAEEPAEPEAPSDPVPEEPEAIPVVANPNAINVMVNKFWSLPEGHRPSDLTKPNVPFSFGNENSDRSKLRAEAAAALEQMFKGAKDEGLELYARSGFRSYETQAAIFENEIATYGYEQAVLYVAFPGTSEHQTGLAMDITAKSVGLELVEKFAGTAEGKWLAENAHEYGFILRYPKGKTSITGYGFEPWHFRYVGVEIAGEIYAQGLTLEEYLGDVREF